MPTLDTLQIDGKYRALAFGHFKSGKTAGALTFPRPNVLDFDRGVTVGLAPWWREKFKIDPNTIQYEQFGVEKLSPRGVPTTYNIYDNACRYFDKSMAKEHVDSFDTWVIDSATTLGESARTKGVILLGGTSLSAKPLSGTQQKAINTGIVVPKIQDYGAERSLVEQFIDMVLQSGKHVVVLAHAKEEYEGEGNDARLVGVTPLLTGQSTQRIPLKFNEVYWIELAKSGPNTDAIVRVSADEKIKRGSRYGLTDKTKWDWSSIRTDLKKGGWSFSPDGSAPSTTGA